MERQDIATRNRQTGPIGLLIRSMLQQEHLSGNYGARLTKVGNSISNISKAVRLYVIPALRSLHLSVKKLSSHSGLSLLRWVRRAFVNHALKGAVAHCHNFFRLLTIVTVRWGIDVNGYCGKREKGDVPT